MKNIIIRSGYSEITSGQGPVTIFNINVDILGRKYKVRKIKIGIPDGYDSVFGDLDIKFYIDNVLQDWNLQGAGFWATKGLLEIETPFEFQNNFKCEITNNSLFDLTFHYYIEIEEIPR